MIITPDIWGPYAWKFIHMVALAYPSKPTEEDKLNYYTFFISISNILPCHLCSDHYKNNLLKHQLTDNVLSSRENLVKWTIDMHNEVNISNNKNVYDYDYAIDLIKNNYNEKISLNKVIDEPDKIIYESNKIIEKENNNFSNNILYILIFVFIILIIIAILYKKC